MKKNCLLLVFCCFSLALMAQNDTTIPCSYLIVLDVQEAYTQNYANKEVVQSTIEAINDLIDATDPDKVIYVKSIPKVLTLSFKGISIDTLENIAIDGRIHRVSEKVFTKDQKNVFEEAEFLSCIQQSNVKSIAVVGLMAEECVKATLLGGVEKGYTMKTIPEAILSKSEKSKSKLLKKLQHQGVVVV